MEAMEAVLTEVTTTATEPLVMTISEAAGLLACSKSQVYALVQAGDIAGVRVGKAGVRISKAELVRFVNSGGVEDQSSASKAAQYRAATRKMGASSGAWRN